MFDIIISGGIIVDGTGQPGYRADLGITGEVIKVIGNLAYVEAKRVVDATGYIVAPGFIDTHTHSDGVLLSDPQHANSLRQGVTTEILGQDGLSYAPLSPNNYRIFSRYLGGLLGNVPDDLDMSSITAFKSHYHRKVSVNTAYCVPHGAIRLNTVGFRDVQLTGDSLIKAKQAIINGIEEGAVGFSTGLSYFPNSWSDTDELVELCKATHDVGGVYVTHLRDVNTDRAFSNGGVPEALEIGRRSGVKVHFSHYLTRPSYAGTVKKQMELIDEAKAEGVDCSLELYPYPTGSTFPIVFLPSYAHEDGPDGLIKRLRDPVERRKFINLLNDNDDMPRDLDGAVFTYLSKNKHFEGMSFEDVCKQLDMTVGEALCDILLEEDLQVGFRGAPPHSVAIWDRISRDCMEFLSRPDYMVGSDSIPIGSLLHPRAFGTFPRFLGRFRRKFDIISLEQMIQRMTENPARRFGLKKRGVVKSGYYADIVIFDAEHINDNATYDDPRQFPTGVPFVLVNGQLAVDHERCTGVFAGQAVP